MRIWIESRYDKRKIVGAAKKHGAVITKKNPDFIITYGGDGTILDASRKFAAPIVPIKKSEICALCMHYSADTIQYILRRLEKREFRIKSHKKIEAVVGKRKLEALNEVQVRSSDPRTALRFSLYHGKKPMNLIGDGIVASTPFGSTGYFSALGYPAFRSGVKIGFNNTKPRHAAIFVKKKCTLKVLRDSAVIYADNNPVSITAKKGSVITIKASKKKTSFVEF